MHENNQLDARRDARHHQRSVPAEPAESMKCAKGPGTRGRTLPAAQRFRCLWRNRHVLCLSWPAGRFWI